MRENTRRGRLSLCIFSASVEIRAEEGEKKKSPTYEWNAIKKFGGKEQEDKTNN